jgi:hypothetical protein
LKKKLEDAITACNTLIDLMQSADPKVKEEATDAARGMLWKWVDEGNATELINLIGAIRLVTTMALEHWEDK